MCNQYEDYILSTNNRSTLTSRHRSEMKEILRTPSILYSSIPDRAERARLQNLKVWTLKNFHLQDNQIYWNRETVRGIEYGRRYAACTYDAFELIARTHRGMNHTGVFLPFFNAYY